MILKRFAGWIPFLFFVVLTIWSVARFPWHHKQPLSAVYSFHPQTNENEHLVNHEGLNALFESNIETNRTEAPASESRSWISDTYQIELKGTVSEKMAVVIDLETGNEHVVNIGARKLDVEFTEIERNRIAIKGVHGIEILFLPTRDSIATQTNNKPLVIPRERLSNMLSNVDSLVNEIALQPIRGAEGGTIGYRVTALKPNGLLSDLGIRSEDVILALNGQRLHTPEDIYRVFGEITHSNFLKIDLRRNNSDASLEFKIR